MDLVRAILLTVEAAPQPIMVTQEAVGADSDDETIARHAGLMIDAGLVTGELTEYCSGGASAFVTGITWEGYDFLDSVRNDEVWRETRANIAAAVGSASFDVVKAVATAFVMRAVGL